MAKLDHQMELEQLYNKNQLMPRIRQEFSNCESFDFVGYMKAQKIDPDFGIDLLTQMALHKRCSLATLVGCLRHHFLDGQKTADAIKAAAEADLVDYSANLSVFIVKFTISADVQEELDRFQFPLPMVVEPAEVLGNLDTGYLCSKGSIILRDNYHPNDVCLDHINRMNKVKLVINHDTARMVKNRWRNLDKAKDGESKADFEKRVRAFEKFDRTAKDVITLLNQEGNEFHLTHRYDKRGRTYCMGYHVSYQAAPWNKAVIEFAEKEHVEL